MNVKTQIGCRWHVCKDVHVPNLHDCYTCDSSFEYKEPSPVYRPHRHAVVWSLLHQFEARGFPRLPRVVLQARLGCPDAVAYIRRQVRARNEIRFRWRERVPRFVHGQKKCAGSDLPERYLGTGLV